METRIVISKRVPEDDIALSHLYYRIRSEEFPWEAHVALGDFYRHTKGEEILVARADGEIAGFLSAWKLGRFVHCLYVAPEYRGMGVGSALLKEAGNLYGYPLALKCMKENRNALRFYKKLGWQITDETPMTKGMCLELTLQAPDE